MSSSKVGHGPIVQVSARGQITLPAEVRRQAGLRAGDPLVVSVEDGRIVLETVVVTPIERYSEAREQEFEDAAAMTPEEIAEAQRKWGL